MPERTDVRHVMPPLYAGDHSDLRIESMPIIQTLSHDDLSYGIIGERTWEQIAL